ncbi:calcium/calmodulin-dependent protein kinase type 1D-like [Scomber scombrus]|uniref:Calcium/calmodulin-dependent protein kinase type 1D-like n=1 Tax=Scomber scombrus TaxID=13677 RepID=A0AAV1NBR5_SCOSC|nr:calcium/calmodulin-dependent protein kinase type 1D-like [Scomber scombrus]
MGQEQSTLEKNGYKIESETDNGVVATKNSDRYLIRKLKISTDAEFIAEIEILKTITHPHIMNTKNSFEDEDQNTYYVVMDYCQGGSLAEKLKEKGEFLQEFEALSWTVEMCMALRTIHEKGLLHRALTPENIFFSKSGTLLVSGFGKIQGSSNNTHLDTVGNEVINYSAPEVFTEETYDAKSEIWSMGCILHELCTQQFAFSAETTGKLISKIISGPYPSLPDQYSSEFCELLRDILNRDPHSRPTACEILAHPLTITCLSKKSKTTAEHLQTQLNKLRAVADNLERVHQGTTIGSLAGGVIGAVGGITSIVGLILAPFTLGASLVVTGIGVGVGVAGGATAGVSNITNMVNQSSDRKAIESIIKEFEEQINAVAVWLQEISNSLQMIRGRCYSRDTSNNEDSNFNQENWARFGPTVGMGLGSVTELFRLLRVVNIGKIAAQASKAVRVAELATGAISTLFLAVDIFFIAMDAKEIHHIRQKHTDGKTRSEIMKFVQSIRQAADELQGVLDELKCIISAIPLLEDERELEWQHMD